MTKAIITQTCTVRLWVQRVVLRLRMKAGRRHFGGGETIVQSISRQGEEYERAAASCCVGVMMQYAQPRRSFEAVKACGSVITFYPTRSDASTTSSTTSCTTTSPVLGSESVRYAAALAQQPEPVYSLICATVGPLLSLRGGGERALSAAFNPKRCCVGFS